MDRQRLSNEQIVVVVKMNEFDKVDVQEQCEQIRICSNSRMGSYSRGSS